MIFAVAAAVALAMPSRISAAPPRDLHALAQRELTIPGRYQLTASPVAAPPQSFLSRAWSWLYARWLQLMHALFARVHVGDRTVMSLGDGLLVLVGLLLLAVAIRLLRNLQLVRSSRLAYEPLAAPLDPQSLYNDARDAANAGDYGGAALLLFAATVVLLDRRGAVEGNRSATVGDLRRELRANDAALISPFDAIAAPFVQKAYAERPVGAREWGRASDAFDTLLQSGAQS
ncbi:MAG: hypothetical protein WAK16_07260 [Candidatus Cybelea sp.]